MSCFRAFHPHTYSKCTFYFCRKSVDLYPATCNPASILVAQQLYTLHFQTFTLSLFISAKLTGREGSCPRLASWAPRSSRCTTPRCWLPSSWGSTWPTLTSGSTRWQNLWFGTWTINNVIDGHRYFNRISPKSVYPNIYSFLFWYCGKTIAEWLD